MYLSRIYHGNTSGAGKSVSGNRNGKSSNGCWLKRGAVDSWRNSSSSSKRRNDDGR